MSGVELTTLIWVGVLLLTSINRLDKSDVRKIVAEELEEHGLRVKGRFLKDVPDADIPNQAELRYELSKVKK